MRDLQSQLFLSLGSLLIVFLCMGYLIELLISVLPYLIATLILIVVVLLVVRPLRRHRRIITTRAIEG